MSEKQQTPSSTNENDDDDNIGKVVDVVPKMGPNPVLLSRKEIDALYETLEAVKVALTNLGVDYIVTGGTLLGAIRQHSILFCDDDIDVSIIDYDNNKTSTYENIVKPKLQSVLSSDYIYQIRPWEGGDRIRPKRMSNVFLDLFVLRKYNSIEELKDVIGIKKNGQKQSDEYIDGIVNKIQHCTTTISSSNNNSNGNTTVPPICPFWHFSTRKAIEMWTKEVYRQSELFPLNKTLKMGPITGLSGPRMPILLLKRAFGDDCFDVYYQSASHHNNNNNNNDDNGTKKNSHHKTEVEIQQDGEELPPLTSAGGTWEGGQKVKLEEEHYIPIQPISRTARRHTMHCKQQLVEYVQQQSKLESQWIKEEITTSSSTTCNSSNNNSNSNERPNRTVYVDGVYDLFHIGHLESIKNTAKLGNRVIIGVVGDVDSTGYKRKPIVPEDERVAIIEALKIVDVVICPCPLIVTEQFMIRHNIDLVVHGFANEQDMKKQEEFFKVPIQLGKFQTIPYYSGLSTTDRIRNIQQLNLNNNSNSNNNKNDKQESNNVDKSNGAAATTTTQWFGSTVATATENSSSIPYDPIPLELRIAIEPHIRKATKRREEALSAIRIESGPETYDSIIADLKRIGLTQEDDFEFDTNTYMIRQALLECLSLPIDYDLRYIHHQIEEDGPHFKDRLLERLTKNYVPFQQTYDEFVRSFCIPQLAAHSSNSSNKCDEYYYQAFPCLRIVQPDEFSIGPHCDVAYGHHPCSINFYVPLTEIGGASSLFLENRMGSEDWHPIEGDYGHIKRFAGAICLHWTTDNKTTKTRVSLDFRIIPGPMFHALKCGGSSTGGQIDVYRRNDGYYNHCCRRQHDDGSCTWEISNTNAGEPLPPPDARVGFPWTVKDWGKFWSKKTK